MERKRHAAIPVAARGRAGTMVSELEVDPIAAVDQEFDQEPIQEAKNPIESRFGSRSGPAVRDQIARAAANNSSAAHKRSSCEERIDRIEKAIEKLLQEPRSHRHSSRRSGSYQSSNESGKESDGNGQYRRLPHGQHQHSSHYQRHREGGKSYQHQGNHQGSRRSGTHHWTSDDSEEESEGRGGSRRSPTVRKNSYEKPVPFKGSQGGYCPPHLPNKATSSPFSTHITCAANKSASKVTMQPGLRVRSITSFPLATSEEYDCNLCFVDCSYKRYNCNKVFDYDLCPNCFASERFKLSLNPLDFTCLENVIGHHPVDANSKFSSVDEDVPLKDKLAKLHSETAEAMGISNGQESESGHFDMWKINNDVSHEMGTWIELVDWAANDQFGAFTLVKMREGVDRNMNDSSLPPFIRTQAGEGKDSSEVPLCYLQTPSNSLKYNTPASFDISKVQSTEMTTSLYFASDKLSMDPTIKNGCAFQRMCVSTESSMCVSAFQDEFPMMQFLCRKLLQEFSPLNSSSKEFSYCFDRSLRHYSSYKGPPKCHVDCGKVSCTEWENFQCPESSVHEGLASGFGLGTVMFIMFSGYGLGVWYGAKLILDKGYTGEDVINVIFAVLTGSFSLGQASPSTSNFKKVSKNKVENVECSSSGLSEPNFVILESFSSNALPCELRPANKDLSNREAESDRVASSEITGQSNHWCSATSSSVANVKNAVVWLLKSKGSGPVSSFTSGDSEFVSSGGKHNVSCDTSPKKVSDPVLLNKPSVTIVSASNGINGLKTSVRRVIGTLITGLFGAPWMLLYMGEGLFQAHQSLFTTAQLKMHKSTEDV